MNRREFVNGGTAFGLAMVSSACSASPFWTQERLPRIAHLSTLPCEARLEATVNPFLAGLHQLGYIEGESITMGWCFGSARHLSVAAAATSLDRLPRCEHPAGISLEGPRVFDLVINRTAARELGIRLPGEVASVVTEWIK